MRGAFYLRRKNEAVFFQYLSGLGPFFKCSKKRFRGSFGCLTPLPRHRIADCPGRPGRGDFISHLDLREMAESVYRQFPHRVQASTAAQGAADISVGMTFRSTRTAQKVCLCKILGGRVNSGAGTSLRFGQCQPALRCPREVFGNFMARPPSAATPITTHSNRRAFPGLLDNQPFLSIRPSWIVRRAKKKHVGGCALLQFAARVCSTPQVEKGFVADCFHRWGDLPSTIRQVAGREHT